MLIPNDEFNCIFVFYHLFHHFMGSGLGFRQLCDWCMCLSKYGKNLDTDELRDKLYSFGMLHSWKVFGYIAVNYLGLNQECMPLYEEYPKCKAEKIIDLIFADGNFGHYSIKRHYSNVYIIQKIYSLYDNIERILYLVSLFPSDAIRHIKNPFNSFEQMCNDVKKYFFNSSKSSM